MSRRLRTGFFMVYWVLVWMIIGCGMQDRTLVQMGNKERITLSEFKTGLDAYFDQEYRRELPDSIPLEVFQRQLDEKIENRLVFLAAKEAGLDQDSTIQQKANDALDDAMMNQLYNDIVIDKAVTENDIRDFWARSGIVLNCRKIEIYYPAKRDSIADQERYQRATDILASARKGEPFSRLARQYSDERVSGMKGGEMSPLWYAENGDPVVEAAFAMKEGQISDLIETPKGWLILKVDKRELKNRKSYEAAREGIRSYLAGQRREKLNEIARDYLAELEKKYGVVVHQDNLDALANRVKHWAAKATPPIVLDSLKASPDEFKSSELITTNQQNIRIADLIDVFAANPVIFLRGKFDESNAIKNFLYKQYQIQSKILNDEARRLGYATNPRVIEKVRQAQESAMVPLYLNKVVYAGYETDTNAVHKYYKEHLTDKYSTPEKVQVQEIQVFTQQKVDQVMDRIKRGEDFGKIASEMTLRTGYNAKKGILPDIAKGKRGDIEEKAFEMNVGEIAVVDLGGNKFSVIKVLAKFPAVPKSFKESAANARRALAKEVMDQKKADWLNAQKESRGVSINEKVLEDLWRSYQKPHAKS